jgi:hypothetical protein
MGSRTGKECFCCSAKESFWISHSSWADQEDARCAAYQFPNWVRVKKSELIDESRIYRRSIASPWVSLKVSN